MIFTSLLRPNLMFITEQNDDKGTTILSIFCNNNKPVVTKKKKKEKKRKERKPVVTIAPRGRASSTWFFIAWRSFSYYLPSLNPHQTKIYRACKGMMDWTLCHLCASILNLQHKIHLSRTHQPCLSRYLSAILACAAAPIGRTSSSIMKKGECPVCVEPNVSFLTPM